MWYWFQFLNFPDFYLMIGYRSFAGFFVQEHHCYLWSHQILSVSYINISITVITTTTPPEKLIWKKRVVQAQERPWLSQWLLSSLNYLFNLCLHIWHTYHTAFLHKLISIQINLFQISYHKSYEQSNIEKDKAAT